MWLGIVLFLVGSTFCQWMLKEQAQPPALKRPIFYNPVFIIVEDLVGVGMTLAGFVLVVRSCMAWLEEDRSLRAPAELCIRTSSTQLTWFLFDEVRFYLDPETDASHIHKHGIDEQEVIDTLLSPGEDSGGGS